MVDQLLFLLKLYFGKTCSFLAWIFLLPNLTYVYWLIFNWFHTSYLSNSDCTPLYLFLIVISENIRLSLFLSLYSMKMFSALKNLSRSSQLNVSEKRKCFLKWNTARQGWTFLWTFMSRSAAMFFISSALFYGSYDYNNF